MKRILVLLCSVLLLAACHDASRDPVIKGYRLNQVSDLSIGQGGVTADMTLDVDVENPSSARYTLEDLQAVLYRNNATAPYADVTMQESVLIAPRSEQTVSIPLTVRFTRPLSLLTEGVSTDLSDYVADIDLTIRKGSLKKRIKQEQVPLERIGEWLGTGSQKQEIHEEE